ncbi:ribonuclease R [Ostreibacterium oceani]|uniref:Ribonuclease R n=1 Tax=Ostreibacterium oceani TaxID=2654998 RepID=A0A6N7EYK0_9GAMM|nr:ribonuclease R [Ostreibacterium oceani]MPV86217.1 ribonuclease R [Ostreibacterium oceani]
MSRNWQKQDPEFSNEEKKYPHPVPSRAFIITTIQQSAVSLDFAALVKHYALNRHEKETLRHRIKAMLRDGQVAMNGKEELRIPKARPKLIGKVYAHVEGYGFFIPEDKSLTDGQDLYLSPFQMKQAMHGDVVEAEMLTSGGRSNKKEGRIIRVVTHANTLIIGKLINDYGIKVVKPENRRIHHKIQVTNLSEFAVKENEIVAVTISQYPNKNNPIVGQISKVFGDHMDAGIEIDVAIANHQLPHEWPDAVVNQTIAIPDEIKEYDCLNRVDLRHLPLVTIDGVTARDFDDAVYAKKTQTGYVLYVAIADVAHYVSKDSPLDQEAKNRATSVYFPNRVIPMLPEKLSNGLCSLNPNVDRLCMVCEMLIDNQGEIKRSKFYEAVMHSKARLTYEAVEEVLFMDNLVLGDEYQHVIPHLQDLKSLYEILRAQRNERGAIGFETTEPEFEFDSAGKIDRISARDSLKSHQLIEEFMVRANVCAANFLLKQRGKHRPLALFRNHLGPSEEKLTQLISMLAKEGMTLTLKGEAGNTGDAGNAEKILAAVSPKTLAAVVEKAKSHENFEAIQLMILRAMFQAVYEAENHGHFGLALTAYAHFTSPIRRYPDLLVHRAIKHALRYKNELYVYSFEQMQQLGEHCSTCERRADDATRDVIDFLKCDYMMDKIDQCFSATISGVTSFGLFATLDEQFVDGLIHISSLAGDYFVYDGDRQLLMGERSRKVYKIGDQVEIRVSDVSTEKRQIDFVLTDTYLPFGGKAQDNAKQPAKKSQAAKKSKQSTKQSTKKGEPKPSKQNPQEKTGKKRTRNKRNKG